MAALVLSDDLEVNTLHSIPLEQLAKDIRIIKDTIKSFHGDRLIMTHAFGWDEKKDIAPMLHGSSFPEMFSAVAGINPASIRLDPRNVKRYSDLLMRKEMLDIQIRRADNASSLMREYAELEKEISVLEYRIGMMATEFADKVDDILCMHAIRSTECSPTLREAMQDERISSGNILSQWQAELRDRHRLCPRVPA